MGKLLREVQALAQPLVEQKENALVVRVLEGLGTMYADLTRVRRAVVNLLSNAAKFTRGARSPWRWRVPSRGQNLGARAL